MKDHIKYISKKEAGDAVNKQAFRVKDTESLDYGRLIVHCFSGSFGAGWDKDDVLKTIAKAKKVAWVRNQIFDHQLGVATEDHIYYFDIKENYEKTTQ